MKTTERAWGVRNCMGIGGAGRLCDRVAILDLGRIVALDTPQALKTASRDPNASLEDVFLGLAGEDDIEDDA